MNNIWITLLLVIVCVLGGYYLSQYWVGLGWIGFIAALVIVGLYIYGRNRRMQ